MSYLKRNEDLTKYSINVVATEKLRSAVDEQITNVYWDYYACDYDPKEGIPRYLFSDFRNNLLEYTRPDQHVHVLIHSQLVKVLGIKGLASKLDEWRDITWLRANVTDDHLSRALYMMVVGRGDTGAKLD